MKNVLLLRFLSPLAPLGWPLVRFVAGAMLAVHGWNKVTGDMGAFAGHLDKMGMPIPTVAAWLSALAELVGGAFMAIGLFARPAGFVVAFNMIVALLLAHAGDIPKIGSGAEGVRAEYPLLLAAVGLATMLRGAGGFSVDGAREQPHVP